MTNRAWCSSTRASPSGPADPGPPRAAERAAGQKQVADAAGLDRTVVQPVRALLERGRADGTLRSDLPADVLLEMFTGLLERSLQLVAQGRLGVETASAACTSFFLDGAGADGRGTG